MEVSRTLDWLARMVRNHPDRWRKFGTLESALLLDLDQVKVSAPVYICGLPRSGSTMLLEVLASHPDVATHRYSDFPFVFIPYWWNKALPKKPQPKKERAHGDRIMVSPQSPEAMEEMLWMYFFDFLHDPDVNNALDPALSVPFFDGFYYDHIRKLMLVRKRTRYVAKNNYNVTRMDYLSRIFPDARFIIPVREPVAHIASLMRQHERFCEAGRKNPRVVSHMSLAGHFEFGLNRRPVNTGDPAIGDIRTCWEQGEEVLGWALYWNMIYRYIHRQLEDDPQLKERAVIVPFEDLCARPRDILAAVVGHAQLPEDPALLDRWSQEIRAPDYYQPSLSAGHIKLIRDITGETASRLISA